jgi:hypothetical protein
MLKYNLKNLTFEIFNNNLINYCRNTTNESIKRISEKNQLKKNLPNIKIDNFKSNIGNGNGNGNGDDGDDYNTEFIYIFFSILSITLFVNYFYKRIK